jgi:hypothetical protein
MSYRYVKVTDILSALQSFKMSITVHKLTMSNIPDEFDLEQQCREELTYHMQRYIPFLTDISEML